MKKAEQIRDFVREVEAGSIHWSSSTWPDYRAAFLEGAELLEVSVSEIDPDEERAHCERVSLAWADQTGWVPGNPSALVAREREAARLQATLAAHKAYRELTDALDEFLYSHDPDDLKRVARAHEKVKGL